MPVISFSRVLSGLQLTVLTLGLGSIAILPDKSAAQTNPPTREITKIAGDLYRFQNNFHFSVFLVTPDGVIATDPINAEAATWLKDEIKTRFNQPIRYVVYSHDHGDHISGGEVFADAGATVVAHAQAAIDIATNNVPTAAPEVTFTDSLTLTLGGKTVNLKFLGKSHSDNMIIAHFPAERTVFAVDFISAKRLPFQTLPDYFIPDAINAIDAVAAMDFDILAPGHGPMGTPQDAADHGQYVKDLKKAVQEAIDAGQSLEQMQASIMMDAYKDWGQHEQYRGKNVEGMHRILTQ